MADFLYLARWLGGLLPVAAAGPPLLHAALADALVGMNEIQAMPSPPWIPLGTAAWLSLEATVARDLQAAPVALLLRLRMMLITSPLLPSLP